ncbi:MAG: vWA domain-containing protein [Candidatus Eiseniibacteriota bacterium]
MRWAEPARLYLLWLTPVLLVLWAWVGYRRSKLEAELGDPQALRARTGEPGTRMRVFRLALTLLGVAVAIAALGRPQMGFRFVTTASRGADVVIALDLSHSMQARDVRPDRLRAAVREITTLLQTLDGSAMGFVAFGGRARVVSPLSTDREGLVSLVEAAGPGDVDAPGSDIGAGVSLAGTLLRRPGDRPRAIVLVTDGENLSGDPRAGLDAVRRSGARLFTIGVGSTEGAAIPIVDTTGVVVGERRGPDGQPVRSKLDENLLRDLARLGGGRYEHGDGGGRSALRIADAIRSSGGQEVRGQTIRSYDEKFPWFAAAAGLLLLAARALPQRRES